MGVDELAQLTSPGTCERDDVGVVLLEEGLCGGESDASGGRSARSTHRKEKGGLGCACDDDDGLEHVRMLSPCPSATQICTRAIISFSHFHLHLKCLLSAPPSPVLPMHALALQYPSAGLSSRAVMQPSPKTRSAHSQNVCFAQLILPTDDRSRCSQRGYGGRNVA